MNIVIELDKMIIEAELNIEKLTEKIKYYEYKKYLTFKGTHPKYGWETSFVFNYPVENHQNILDWDDNKWWYSKDAGLSWEIISKERYVDLVESGNADMIMSKVK